MNTNTTNGTLQGPNNHPSQNASPKICNKQHLEDYLRSLYRPTLTGTGATQSWNASIAAAAQAALERYGTRGGQAILEATARAHFHQNVSPHTYASIPQSPPRG